MNTDKLQILRHSTAHVLATAVLEMFPEAKFGIGPAIENGFYYDFDLPRTLIPEDLPLLEEKMREIIKTNYPFEKQEIEIKKSVELFKKAKQDYKVELIKDIRSDTRKGVKEKNNSLTAVNPKQKSTVTLYKTGNFVDLCLGPHIDSTGEINPDAFKLTRISGAYWKGSEKNKMLQRIYGTAWEAKKELDEYLHVLEEAEKRDHRKLGKELDLFSFHEEGAGFPFWHPKGMIIYGELVNFISKENEKRGYGEVKTPPILRKNLWITSGHWEKFKESMYFTEIEGEEFAIKPMNCPGGLLIYKENLHSYRDLPLRYSEFGLVHRHELSGVLHGLFRVRSFTQDDAHVFCATEQLDNEIIQMVDYALDVYKTFGFAKYEIFIATKPEKYIGNDDVWEKATDALEESLKSKKIKYGIKEGEGAFYGPKIEFNIKDAIGRNWQLGTIQVDFSMPARFDAFYIDKDGKKQNSVMVHRAILGSLERFIGILIEHYTGALPVWLSPVQVAIIPIGKNHIKYANSINNQLKTANIRTKIKNENETMGKKIREAEMQKIPYMLIIGDKEIEANSISLRDRKKGDLGTMEVEEFVKKIISEIKDKI